MINKIICPAKINLFLEINGKRESDGYHTLDTVMQTISLADTVTVRLEKGTGHVNAFVDGLSSCVPADDRNIAVKAAKKYLDAFGIRGYDASIMIEKRIPVMAGLGGGSADAAGVLRALESLLSFGDEGQLAQLALSLGADVPFCLRTGTCRAQGIGEILTPCTEMSKDTYIVIAKGEKGVSTAEAYRQLDMQGENIIKSADSMIESLNKCDLSFTSHLFNRFEDVVLPELSEARDIKRILCEKGSIGSLMSGSGSAVFAIFENDASASAALGELHDLGVFACKSRPFSITDF